MITKIKQLADEAIQLQNKNRMDEVLREISAMCGVKASLKTASISAVAVEPISEGDVVVATGKGVKPAKGGNK
ncbi:MAG: hypothetical protein WCD86_11100 [Ktedonobacteraceae bacterium]